MVNSPIADLQQVDSPHQVECAFRKPLQVKYWCLTPVFGGCEQALAAARPRWIDHMLLNEIFDGDMAYLAKASHYAKARPTGPSSSRPCRWGITSKPWVVL